MGKRIEEVSFHDNTENIIAVVDGVSSGPIVNQVCEVLNSEPVTRILKRRLSGGSLESDGVIHAGREAYEAYANVTGWKSLATGADLPQWDGLTEAMRQAWNVSAAWVVGRVMRQHGLI